MTTPLLTMQHITKSFYGVKVLDDVSIDLRSGETLALLAKTGRSTADQNSQWRLQA